MATPSTSTSTSLSANANTNTPPPTGVPLASSRNPICSCRTITAKGSNNGDLVNEALKNILGTTVTTLSPQKLRTSLDRSFREETINGVKVRAFQPSPVDINIGSGGRVSAFRRHLVRLYQDTKQSMDDALQALQPVSPNVCCPDSEYEGIKEMMRALLRELGNELQRMPSRNDARIEEIFLLLLGTVSNTANSLWQKLSDATKVPSPPKKENEIEADNNLILFLNELAHLRGYWNRRASLEIGLLAERDDIQQNLSVVSSNLQNFIDDCDAINLEAAERGTIIITDSTNQDPDMNLEELLTWLGETVEVNIPAYLDTNFSGATQTCIDVLEKITTGFTNLDKTILPPSINNVTNAVDGLITQLKS